MEKYNRLIKDIKNTTDFFNDIIGLFVDINLTTGLVTLYGDNKEIVGINKSIVRLTKDEVIEFFYEKKNIDLDDIVKEYYLNGEKIEFCIKNKANDIKRLCFKGTQKYEKDILVGFEGYIYDVTYIKHGNSNIINNSVDCITELYVKEYFQEKISTYLANKDNLNKRGALIFLGIDNFKYINDSFGIKCGDIFLRIIFAELKKVVEDERFLCRLQGDEFLIFIHDIKSLNYCEEKVKEVIEIFNKSYYIQNKHIYVTTSVGIAIYPDDGQEFDLLLRNCDAAMSMAKNNGKNQYQFFDNKISTELDRRYTIEKELVSALENNELFVLFQPKVRLQEGQVNGFEALIRWKSKELGNISPAEFIPIAENSNMIIPIGKFVLKEVFLKVKYLLDNGYDNFKIAFNLSEIQLREGTIINYFEELISIYGNLSKYIEIEITESMLMESVDRNIRSLMYLKGFGVSIALDDFGTGYSSLNHLTRLPIDVLKIDRSFLIDIIDNDKSKYVVENIVQLSHKLGIEVVAEGVEEKEQVEYLKDILCDIVQGYYYSKPEKFEKAMKLLGGTNEQK